MPRNFFDTVGSSVVPGSTASSWTRVGRDGSEDIYYNAGTGSGSTGTFVRFNPTSGSFVAPASGTPERARLESRFRSSAAAADSRALGRPTTPRAGAGGAGASSIPVIPFGSSGSGSGGASGSPRTLGTPSTDFGARGAKYSYYPEDLATTKQDRIKFEMFTASTRRGEFGGRPSGSGLAGFGPRSGGEPRGIVFLGIQGQISDSNSVDWSGSTINPLQAALAQSAIAAMTTEEGLTGQGVAGMMNKLMFGVDGVFTKAKDFIKSANNTRNLQILLAQEAVQAQGLLSRIGGQVANPNLELLFNGPQLRPFTFNFRMTPRNTTEANRVKKIIRFFKEGMAVQTTENDIFLKSPNTFKIQFQSGESGNAHTSLPRIKECALIRCDVNYTPDGSYMTFADSIEGYPMTCYELSLAFSEIDPVIREDYSGLPFDGPNMEIGY